MARRRLLTLLLAICLVTALVVVSVSCTKAPATPTPAPAPTPAPKPAPSTVRIGSVVSLSGVLSAAAQAVEVPARDFWVEKVNKEGGIYVPQYDKRIPVELIQYDDKSELGTSAQLLERLITVEKVDFTLPPNGTAQHVAQVPIANKYKQPWIVCTGTGTTKFQENPESRPYTFFISLFPPQNMGEFADLMKELGVKTAAIIFVEQELGVGFTEPLVAALPERGIEVVMKEGFPVAATDFNALLKKAQATNADAFIANGYPPCTFAVPKQAATLNYNPKLVYLLIGTVMQPFINMYGPAGMEGIMSVSGWNKKVSPEAAKFYDEWVAFYDREPQWSDVYTVATYEILEQAIAKVGYEDLDKLRDVIATDTFVTSYTTAKFEGQFNNNVPATVSQWLNGIHEPIMPKAKRQVTVQYPKAPWPKM